MTANETLPSPERLELNFGRRYKWLCAPQEDDPYALLFPLPSLSDFRADIIALREVIPLLCCDYQRAHDK